MEIERHMGPRRSSSGTLIRECLAYTQLSAQVWMVQCVGTGPHRGKETRMLIGCASTPLSGVELSGSIVVRTCNGSKDSRWDHLCRSTARRPGLGMAEWGG